MEWQIIIVTIFVHIFVAQINLIKCQEDIPPNSTTTQTFVKLDVPIKYLKGARWEIDTKNPKHIYHSVEITDISRISVENGDFRLDLNIRQRWNEEQLVFPKDLFLDHESNDTWVAAESDVLAALWVPDMYLPNARQSAIESLVTKHAYVSIFKNRTIIYYATLTATLGCQMEFQWFPKDVQSCALHIESHAYASNKVIFEWENITPSITIPDQLKLRRYILNRPLTSEQNNISRFGREDSFSRISIIFVFERELGYHLIQVFIPTFLIVSLSWFSFWLGLDAIPGRVGLLVTCMLTMITIYTGLKSDLPPVAYIKILDIWMAACLLFIFASMSEFVIVRTINHTQKAKNEQHDKAVAEAMKESHSKDQGDHEQKSIIVEKMEKMNDYIANPYPEFYSHGMRTIPISRQMKNNANTRNLGWDIHMYDNEEPTKSPQRLPQQYPNYYRHNHTAKVQLNQGNRVPHHKTQHRRKKSRIKPLWEKIDIASRVVFPLLFLCFCLVYWPILIFGSQVQRTQERSRL